MAGPHNAAFAGSLVAALGDLGLAGACLSPGSRSTPLTLAFAGQTAIPVWVHHDERSAGFFAIGLARATGRPVALVCTSGTAAAEYHPAVAEAAASRVPLLVLTADRPAELRDVGAPQTIDQIKLYGETVKWFHHGEPPTPATVAGAPHLAAHAWGEAVDAPAGPVHLNLPFREPLLDEPSTTSAITVAGAPAVDIGVAAPTPGAVAALAEALSRRRVLYVAGALPPDAAPAIHEAAVRNGAVTFADPQSGLRFGPLAGSVVASADLLAAAGALDLDPPEVVVRWGALPTSKPVWRWLETHPSIPQFVIDDAGHRDPLGSAHRIVRADPAATAKAIAPHVAAPPEWADGWRDRDGAVQSAVAAALAEQPFPNEPTIARAIMAAAPEGGAVFAGSSMPIRDIDAYAAPRPSAVRVLANRGANGIDGSISTALGVGAGGLRTVALIGDVAALHDVSALGTAARLGAPVTIVVVHNDGGGIFNLLPQADPAAVAPDVFERTFGTPHGTDFVAVARSFGLASHEASTEAELTDLVRSGGAKLVQVRTDRAQIASLRRTLVAAASSVLPGARPGG